MNDTCYICRKAHVMKKILCLLPAVAVVFLFACKKEEVPPVVTDQFDQQVAPFLQIGRTAPDYQLVIPDGYTYRLYTDMPLPNSAKATLGRVLFYDQHLSKDGKVSCGSCHDPAFAFAENTAKSTGIFDRVTKRNSMALLNTIWLGGYFGMDSVGNTLLPLFWDNRSHSVTDQSRQAFTNPDEMGMTIPEVVQAVREQPYYSWLFEQAWGDTAVLESRIFESISHFMSGMGARNTGFDQALKKAGGVAAVEGNFPDFSPQLNRGKTLFLNHCESCHGSLTSVPRIFEANNGLESPYIDQGKGAITGNFYEKGIFKVPGLRNIVQSAPYMHDGRFTTLEQVVEHYNSGVKQVFGLHGDLLTFNPDNQTYSPQRLNLSETDKQALVAFLHTLTDEASMTDPRFADPFKR